MYEVLYIISPLAKWGTLSLYKFGFIYNNITSLVVLGRLLCSIFKITKTMFNMAKCYVFFIQLIASTIFMNI